MRSAVAFALLVVASACDAPAEDAPPAADVPQAWLSVCADIDVDVCLADGPGRCPDSGPPQAACEACGCPGRAACVVDDAGDGTCASAAVQDARRDAALVSDGQDDIAYFALLRLFDDTATLTTLADLTSTITADARVDGRRGVVVVGREAFDRADVVIDAIGGDVLAPTGDTCRDRTAAIVGHGFGDVSGVADITVDIGAVDDATDALCAFPGSIARCVLPHRVSCLARGGAIATTVVVVDDDVFLPRLDDALLRSLARVGRATWEQRLDSAIGAFQSFVLEQRPEARFAVSGDGDGDGGTEVRVVTLVGDGDDVDPFAGRVMLARLPRFNLRPTQSLAFRLLWRDGPTQAFLTDHDTVPADCRFGGADDAVDVVCTATDGATLEAVVDTVVGRITSIQRTPGTP